MLIRMTPVPAFDPSPGEPAYLYARVADHIQARIEAGDLPPHSRLSGERDLAAEYGVALGTVRRAVKELRRRGLVVTLAAKGTYIASREQTPDSDDRHHQTVPPAGDWHRSAESIQTNSGVAK